jgi:hypothetical protein
MSSRLAWATQKDSVPPPSPKKEEKKLNCFHFQIVERGIFEEGKKYREEGERKKCDIVPVTCSLCENLILAL